MARRVTRRVLSLALAGAVVLGATACAGTQKPGPAGNGQNVPNSTVKK